MDTECTDSIYLLCDHKYSTNHIHRTLVLKNQSSANMVKEQLRSLSSNIGIEIQPVFRSKPIQQILRPKEKKPDLDNNKCVVYHFKCGKCGADYVGFTTRHLHQSIQEHRYSAIGKHLINIHGGIDTSSLRSFLYSLLAQSQNTPLLTPSPLKKVCIIIVCKFSWDRKMS